MTVLTEVGAAAASKTRELSEGGICREIESVYQLQQSVINATTERDYEASLQDLHAVSSADFVEFLDQQWICYTPKATRTTPLTPQQGYPVRSQVVTRRVAYDDALRILSLESSAALTQEFVTGTERHLMSLIGLTKPRPRFGSGVQDATQLGTHIGSTSAGSPRIRGSRATERRTSSPRPQQK